MGAVDGPWLGQTIRTRKRYVIIEVGCLECGEPTTLIEWADEPPEDALVVRYGEDSNWADWYGEAKTVALDLDSLPT